MTQLLEQAFVAVSQLPEAEQDEFAAWIFDELTSEQRWAQAFAQSHKQLAELAAEALAEHRAGHTQALNIEQL